MPFLHAGSAGRLWGAVRTTAPDVQEALAKLGIEKEDRTPAEFEAFLRRLAAQTQDVADKAGLKLE